MSRAILRLLLCLMLFFSVAENAFAVTKVQVDVDPRIELLSIVQYLADYDTELSQIDPQFYKQLTGETFPYKTVLVDHFRPYRNHPVVLCYKEMLKCRNLAEVPLQGGFWLGAPVEALLHFSAPPELKLNRELSEFAIRRSGGKDRLLEFAARLRDFVKESHYEEFRHSQREFYQAVADDIRNQDILDKYVSLIDDYYGYTQNSYEMILAPLYNPVGFGPSVKAPNGRYDVYYVSGVFSVANGLPHFGDPTTFRYMAWHEFSHPFINHMVDQYYAEFKPYESLLDPILHSVRKSGYGDWNNVINEHLVRAVNVRLTALHVGPQAAEELMNSEVKLGFAYLPALCERLKQYESLRAKYRTIDDFFPEFVSTFKELYKKSRKSTPLR
jgi:hypothetical protein